MNIKTLVMRFSDGGAQPPAEPTAPAAPMVIAPAPTPVQAAATPTAVNVDINSIISQAETKASEAAEKKMEAVFKSMLQQQGLDTETINKMTEEWRSKQTTPEQIIQGKDAEIQQRDGTITQLQQQIETERQEKIALSKGVPLGAEDEAVKEKAVACFTLAKSYMSDTVPFESALEKALQIISFKEETPPADPKLIIPTAGTPGMPPAQSEVDSLKAQYQKAASLRNTAEMSRLTRLAKEKKIKLF